MEIISVHSFLHQSHISINLWCFIKSYLSVKGILVWSLDISFSLYCYSQFFHLRIKVSFLPFIFYQSYSLIYLLKFFLLYQLFIKSLFLKNFKLVSFKLFSVFSDSHWTVYSFFCLHFLLAVYSSHLILLMKLMGILF